MGGTLYFSVDGDLWTTDGTAQDTQELEDSSSNPIPAPAEVFGYQGQVYYESYSNTTDSSTIGVLGTGGETPIISNLPRSLSDLVVAGPLFYFLASGSGYATQLWASDGTQANTRMVEDFSSISATSGPTNLVNAGGTLFFTVAGSDGQAQLWKSDGTSGGTTMVQVLGVAGASATATTYPATSYSGSEELLPIGGTLFFTADDGTHGVELWSDDVATGDDADGRGHQPRSGRLRPHRPGRLGRPARLRRQRRHQSADQPALDVGRDGRDHLVGAIVLARLGRERHRPQILVRLDGIRASPPAR